MDLATVMHDLMKCKACVDENHDLHVGLAEIEDGAEDHLLKLNDCLIGLRCLHTNLDELRNGLSSLRETVKSECVPLHECQNNSEISKLKFRFDLLLHSQESFITSLTV